MKQKRPFTTGEKLMTAVMALCLAAACVMGVLFFRVTRENSEAEKEQVLLEQAALATAAPTARLEPTKQEPQTTVPHRSPAARTAEPTETAAPQETAKESAEEAEQESGGETEPLEEEIVEEEDPTLLAILYAEQQAKLSATAAPTPTAVPTPTDTPKPIAAPVLTSTPGTTGIPGATDAPILPDLPNPADQPGVMSVPSSTKAPTATATPKPTGILRATLRPPETPTPEPTFTPTPKPTPAPTVTPTAEPPKVGTAVQQTMRYSVDFDSLRAINGDVVGWLLQEGTEINFPIVQGEDNEYYLNHLYTGAVNRTGAVFADANNSPYFSDMCTYLYGHNRKNGSMFASIPNYMDHDYYEEHPTLTLITPYEDYIAEVFACVRESTEQDQTWRVRQFGRRAEYDEFVQSILERSTLDTGVVPKWGDQLLALCTCTNEVHEDRYIVFARLRPIVYASDESVSVMKMEMDAIQGTSHTVHVPGRGEMQYYAQNDPIWARMRYEARGSNQARIFGQGGCGPTSMAMAIANLVPEESLGGLAAYAKMKNGFTFCTCSVNQYYCNHTHAQYRLETPAEFKRYLPVAMASFATGNNIWGENSRADGGGTSTAFMKRATEAYGLYFTLTKDRDAALSALEDGAMVVASTGGASSPFTGGGHYLTLASVYEGKLYILDPYLKTDYSKTDKRHLLTQIEPGLLEADLEDIDELLLYTFYIIDTKEH